ncbi:MULTISPECIES: hypothetical protein [Moorena]|nr:MULTISPECIES: hypothetical protein [Moorena]OLT53522.1 hypothetical protein BI334_33140 [Moorena producens 3L]
MAIPGESSPNINQALVALGESLRSEFQALIGEYTAGGLAGNYLTSEDCSELRCLEKVVSQVGQLGEEFTALETWLTSGFIPKGLATPIDADSGYDYAPLAPQRAIPRWGEQNSQSPPSEQSLARGDLGGFSQTRPSPIHTSIQQHPTPNPTMEDSWSTPVGGDQVSQGNNSDVFVNSGDVQFSRVESGATRRQKAEGTGQKVPTTTPAQELTLDQELFPSASKAPSTQSRSKQPTLDRNEALLPKHSSNVQGLKELAELLASQEQLDLANPNLVSASDPTLHSNLVDRGDFEHTGDQVLFTHATPDLLIDSYRSGEQIGIAESSDEYEWGGHPARACFQSFPPDDDPPQPPLIRGEPYSKSPERAIPRSGDNGGTPSLKTRPSPRQETGKMPIPQNSSNHAMIKQPQEISGGSPETWQRFPLGADTDITPPQALQTSSDPSAISPQRSALSDQPSAISPQPSAISPQRSAISHYPLPITHYPLPITHHPSPITHYPLPITHYPLPITHSSDPSKLETEVETEMIRRNGTPEMDLDQIMDAIASKVSREYRRFYGSS